MKTLKQIRNLKDYVSDDYVMVWTARLTNGNWEYGWYRLTSVTASPNDFLCSGKGSYEYTLQLKKSEIN